MTYTQVDILVRWLHVIAGITWIGHLYFFNFVNVPLQGVLDDATKKAVNKELLLRALFWFRWGAMVTFLAGLALFTLNYMYTPEIGFGPSILFSSAEGLTSRGILILLGMLFGSIMWFNVWFIIWPTQKSMLTGQVPAEQLPAARAKAKLFSRINVFLSGPMLFFMLAAPHFGNAGPVAIIAFILIGGGAMHLAVRASDTAGKP